MAKGRNYSKKNKANNTAIKDSIRSNNVSKDSKKGNNKEIKEVFHCGLIKYKAMRTDDLLSYTGNMSEGAKRVC